MVREEEGVDGMAHSCTLTPATQQILKKCFEDLVSSFSLFFYYNVLDVGIRNFSMIYICAAC